MVSKIRPRAFTDLLSPEYVNREVVHWIKGWDKVVFDRDPPPATMRQYYAERYAEKTSSLSGGKDAATPRRRRTRCWTSRADRWRRFYYCADLRDRGRRRSRTSRRDTVDTKRWRSTRATIKRADAEDETERRNANETRLRRAKASASSWMRLTGYITPEAIEARCGPSSMR